MGGIRIYYSDRDVNGRIILKWILVVANSEPD